MYQHLMQHDNQNFNNQDYELLYRYILKNYLIHQNSVQIDNNNLRLTGLGHEKNPQFLETDLPDFLRIANKYLFNNVYLFENII